MQRIRNTVSGPTEPSDTHVFWVDTSDPENPVLKMFNGGWVAVSEPGGGGGGSSSSVILELGCEEWPMNHGDEYVTGIPQIIETLGITEEEYNDIVTGKVIAIRWKNLLFQLAASITMLKTQGGEWYIPFGTLSAETNYYVLTFHNDSEGDAVLIADIHQQP